jgi:hypothetical protein
VFEVAVDYSERAKTWAEVIRIWCITRNYGKYSQEQARIEASYRRSLTLQERMKLAPVKAALQASIVLMYCCAAGMY